MAPPVRTITNVLVGLATMYYAPTGTPQAADTVALGENWGAPWVHPGYSEEGLKFSFDRSTDDHNVEEQSNPVLVTIKSSDFTVGISLAEDTLENIKLAYGGGAVTTQASAVGVIGKKTLKLSDTLDQLAIGFEGVNPAGFWRRVYIPRVVSTGKVETDFRRSDSKRMYPAEFHAVCAMQDIVITDMTAAAQ